MLFQDNFLFLKDLFFFFWFLTLKNSFYTHLFCPFLVREFAVLNFQVFLSLFFVCYLLLIFFVDVSSSDLKRSLIITRVLVNFYKNYKFSTVLLAIKLFFFNIFASAVSAFKSCVSFFKKGSKKEFSSEKVNALLLKKKKQESFLKKFYRS
jgi:hypothetical protein